MGDAGEGWVDAEARIHERMEELQAERDAKRQKVRNAETTQLARSLQLARTELVRQLNASRHAARKAQLTQAIEDIDKRIAAESHES